MSRSRHAESLPRPPVDPVDNNTHLVFASELRRNRTNKRNAERRRSPLPFHGWGWALGASTLAAGIAVVGVRPAAAQSFHSYSVASQTTPSGAFTGVATTRQDVPVANIPDTGCSGYFSGNPVYQTEWIYITSDGANWLELGTGHQCMNTLVYWYAGYGFAGTWHPLWEESGITPAGHDFQIYEFGSSGLSHYFD